MSDQEFPVTVAVHRRDGTVEHVRVGTATRHGEGFSLRLGEMTIGGAATQERHTAPISAPPGGGMALPNYGRAKGQPVAGARMEDLEYYAAGARRTLGNPEKARWHDKERVLLAALEAEMARQKGGLPPMVEPPAPGDDDAPPPRTDDDIPF